VTATHQTASSRSRFSPSAEVGLSKLLNTLKNLAVEAVIREPVSDLVFPDTAENTGIFAPSEILQMQGHVEFHAMSVC
jgi:hypothetical protein